MLHFISLEPAIKETFELNLNSKTIMKDKQTYELYVKIYVRVVQLWLNYELIIFYYICIYIYIYIYIYIFNYT